jgi:hypothetical protein
MVGAVTVAVSTSALAATGALAARLQQPVVQITKAGAGVPAANQNGAAAGTAPQRANRSQRQPAGALAPARGPIAARTSAAPAGRAPASAPARTTAAAPRRTTIAPPPRTPTAPPPTKATTPPPPPPTSSGGS